MKRRKLLIAFGASTIGVPLLALAQQSTKVFHIGFLGGASAPAYAKRLEALRGGLRELGYVEGKNIDIEFRWADGNYQRLAEMAAELVARKVDIIITHGTPSSRILKKATSTIPVVLASSGDPVASGVVTSLAHPGGNITGLTIFSLEIYAKRLELLKEAFPRIRRIAFLVNPANPLTASLIPSTEAAAKSLGVTLHRFEARQPRDFDAAFVAMAKARAGALLVAEDGMLIENARAAADAAIKHRLPSISSTNQAENGCLIGYGVDQPDLFRRAATYVDKILKGAKPADLPIERATKFELVFNRATAKALGITISQQLLLRADREIG